MRAGPLDIAVMVEAAGVELISNFLILLLFI